MRHRLTLVPSARRNPLARLALFLCVAGLTTAANATIQFTDVSAAAGVDVHLSTGNGHSLGINWLDYDNDGWPDLFAVGGSAANGLHLFHNEGDGTFTDVSDDLLPVIDLIESSGSVFADYDNDGDVDIYVYTDNPVIDAPNPADGPPNFLFKNLWADNGGAIVPGQPLFEEVAAAAGVDDLAETPFGDLPGYRAKTAAWLDYNRDGCVDLYVGHWVMRGGSENPANRDRLYRNNCDGTFTDAADEAGLTAMGPGGLRPALASIGALLNEDLWPDLYVVHATPEDSPLHWDFNFRNQGGTFTETFDSTPGIGSDTEAGMGIDVADIDLDGDWDIYISDLVATPRDDEPKGNAMYLCNPDGTYQDNVAVEAGTIGHKSWGVNFFDADQDGWEDLFVVTMNGAPEDLFYRNNGDGTFTNVAAAAGVADRNGRGSAVADFDRDGDLDFAVANVGSRLQLYRNDSTDLGNWLQVDLYAVESNASAINALVTVESGGVQRMRQVKGGSSGHGQDSLALHFGLGTDEVADRITVQWPSGRVDVLRFEPTNRRLAIVEGAAPDPYGLRFNGGGGDYLSTTGLMYGGDRDSTPSGRGFIGGGATTLPINVQGTDDDLLYASLHHGSSFGFEANDLEAGVYDLTFSFVEPYFRAAGRRLFDVAVEGVVVLDDYDVYVAAGRRRLAHTETVRAQIDGNGLDIAVDVVASNNAVVSAIDVEPVVFRMNGGAGAYDLRSGEGFEGDAAAGANHGFSDGKGTSLNVPIFQTADADFYRSLHYGPNFSYSAPGLDPGTYEVTLYFAEPYFSGAGRRTFDVFAEGVLVLDDYDIRVAAGGRRRPVSETLIVDVVDGALEIDFTAVRSRNAIVSGIAVRALTLLP